MPIISAYARERVALMDVRTQEAANYSTSKNQECGQLLLDIKDIELRLSALPNIILTASKGYSISPIGTTGVVTSPLTSLYVTTYSPYMRAKAQEKVLKELLLQKKAQANSMACFEQQKAVQEEKKITELDNLITDSNVKAESQIIPQTKKTNTKTLMIGGGILVAAMIIILLTTKRKKS